MKNIKLVCAATIIFFLLIHLGNAQNETMNRKTLIAYEDTLVKLKNIILNSKDEQQRKELNEQFLHLLENVLTTPNSFNYPFNKIPSIAILTPTDRTFRIFNWNLPFDDGTHQYFGIIQTYDKKRKAWNMFTLIDKSDEIFSPQYKIMDYSEWFGALYYEIIQIKEKNNIYYTLLGWDGNNALTTKKIIDVISFDEKNVPLFGAEIFEIPQQNKKRILFEYSAKVVMSLKYDAKTKQIIFDHLSPQKPELKGQYSYYGPDLSYDTFQLKKGKWVYKENVDIKGIQSKEYHNPK